MSSFRKGSNPSVRREAVLIVLAAACLGALLIFLFERYRGPLRDWVVSDPEASAQRARLLVLLLAAALLAPLLGFGAYLWSLGERVVQARAFPPPGLRVIRDTPLIQGENAVSRGRLLKMLALGCAIACAVLGVLLWRLVSVLSF